MVAAAAAATVRRGCVRQTRVSVARREAKPQLGEAWSHRRPAAAQFRSIAVWNAVESGAGEIAFVNQVS